jgi:hypothetical protein
MMRLVGHAMITPVYQLDVVDPEAGVDAVLADLLALELPGDLPDRIAVAALDVSSERLSDIARMTRKGCVFDRTGFRDLLEHATVTGGWFFFGATGEVGDAVEPVDVPRLLERSAFVADVLDGRFLCVRTVRREVADALRTVIVGATVMEPCELEEVRLMY